jgi:hypothetical protein
MVVLLMVPAAPKVTEEAKETPSAETSNPAGAVAVMPALIDEPETVNVLTVVEAFGWVALTPVSVPVPAEIVDTAVTVLETVATLTLVALKLDKTTLPLYVPGGVFAAKRTKICVEAMVPATPNVRVDE